MLNRVVFSSATNHWKTPNEVFDGLHREFNFQDDPCPLNSLIDGLARDWKSPAFVNPPYSDLKQWSSKAWAEAQKGSTVVMLIPSRTDTKWWHDYILKATEIRFIKGRLKFSGCKFNAPFPSCVVVFNGLPREESGSPHV